MPARTYVPDRGDFIWIDLVPRTGHEQSGRRPAVVLSPKSYNRKTGLCLICPATRQIKGYAFEVTIDDGQETSAILADHVRSVDWKARKAQKIKRLSRHVVDDVVAKLDVLIHTS